MYELLSFGMHVTSALNRLLIVVKARKINQRPSVNSRHNQKWYIAEHLVRQGKRARTFTTKQTIERSIESDHVKITKQYITIHRLKRPNLQFMNAPATLRIHTQKAYTIHRNNTRTQNTWITRCVCDCLFERCERERTSGWSAHDNSKYQNNKNTEL